jgi:hypothetical protein
VRGRGGLSLSGHDNYSPIVASLCVQTGESEGFSTHACKNTQEHAGCFEQPCVQVQGQLLL